MKKDICIKCNEPKQAGATECHNCGVIYEKAEMAEKKKIEIEKKRRAEEQQEIAEGIKFQYQFSPEKIITHLLSSACRFTHENEVYVWGTCTESNKHQVFASNKIIGTITTQQNDKVVEMEQIREVNPPESEWSALGEEKPTVEEREEKSCPYCGETILAVAIKCKHCKEFLVSNDELKQIQNSNFELAHESNVNFELVNDPEVNLTKCSDCGASIEEKSDFCSDCGNMQVREEKVKQLGDPIQKHQTLAEQVYESEARLRKIKQALFVIFIVTILLAIAIPNYLGMREKAKEASGAGSISNTANKGSKADAIVACQQAIENASKYGANPSIFGAGTTETGDGFLVRFSDFEINNAFGAKLKSTATCRYDTNEKNVWSLRINGEKVF